MPRVRVTINMSEESHVRLTAAAEAKGISLSAYLLKKAGEKPLPVGRPWPKKAKAQDSQLIPLTKAEMAIWLALQDAKKAFR